MLFRSRVTCVALITALLLCAINKELRKEPLARDHKRNHQRLSDCQQHESSRRLNNLFTPTNLDGALYSIPIISAFASSHVDNYAAENAIDSNRGSRWTSKNRNSEWLAVELNGVYLVEQVTIDWGFRFRGAFKIDTSTDGRSWSTRLLANGKGKRKSKMSLPSDSVARYVRMTGTRKGRRQIGYSVYGIVVRGRVQAGGLSPTPRPWLTINPTRATPTPSEQLGPIPIMVRAYSSSHEKTHVAENAIDKRSSTRWASDRSDNQWIAVELLQLSTVGCVVLQWEAAYGREYRIDTSVDGTIWKTQYVQTYGGGRTEKIQLPARTVVKYVRLACKKRGTRYGYSLWELDVRRGCNEPPSPLAPATARPTLATRLPTSNSPMPPPSITIEDQPLLAKVGNNGSPSKAFPLKLCHGDCDSPTDCEGSLQCFQRNGFTQIPGCQGRGEIDRDYCYESSTLPSPRPQQLPLPLPPGSSITYYPGNLSVRQLGWKLSQGLRIREIAHSGERVRFVNGGLSGMDFHRLPDGAECFVHPDGAHHGFAYVSNSEEDGGKGGVGAIYFNTAGDVVDYRMLLRGTWRNCGAAKTPWDSYMTMEEQKRGRGIWQVDAWNRRAPQLTVLGLGPDSYESFAYDFRDENEPKFFFTVDREAGPVGRFIPSRSSITTDPSKQWEMLHDNKGVHKWLVLKSGGKFEWSSSKSKGEASSKARFRYGEGIEHHDGKLYLVSKRQREMFILDLDHGTYSVESTRRGYFRGTPDQTRFQPSSSRNQDPMYPLLYFTEEGSSPGVHVRTMFDEWFTVLERDGGGGETSGLALTPDSQFMFVALQSQGRVFQLWRSDGRPFNDPVVKIKYM